jgi:threonylcarbamoyladenosine tRNA methylthiotransferase MtaB
VVFEGEATIGGISDIRIHGHDGKHVIGSLVQTQLQQAV